jgi:hypothetical protein
MDFIKILSKEHSIDNALDISSFLIKNPSKISDFFEIYWGNDIMITQRAALVIIELTNWRPKLIKPFVEPMILKLKKEGINDAIKRNTVRILAEFPIPEHMEGETIQICFNYLNNPSEAIAIKVFSMTILERMVAKYPELKPELIYAIETGMEFGSAGYRSRGGKILERLKKLNTLK